MKRQEPDGHVGRHYRPKLAVSMALGWILLVPGASSAADRIRVEMVPAPASDASLTPFLAAFEEGLFLSWLEKTDSGHRLQVARFDGSAFGLPTTVRASERFFANWADFASVLPFGKGRLAAHWLEKAGSGTYDYDVWVSISDDRGTSWGAPTKLHRDGKLGEHGFVSLVPSGDEGFAAAWLDSRNFDEGAADHEMALLFTRFDGTAWGEETFLDERVCECCQTGMAATGGGLFVAYRDRSHEEIRDIGILRFDGTKWSEPATIHEDGWHLTGCPVNGPQVAAAGDRLALAWFTASNDDPRVQLVFSTDGGRTFGTPVRVDEGDSIGRVDVELVSGAAVVSWLERGGAVRARRVSASGELSASIVVAETGSDRASGFPRTAVFGGDVYIAWTEAFKRPGPSRVHLARLVME